MRHSQIWKYPLRGYQRETVRLPIGARILTAQAQDGVICLWALVDPAESRTAPLDVQIFGTGHSIHEPETLTYIGTAQAPPFVWHVFTGPASPEAETPPGAHSASETEAGK